MPAEWEPHQATWISWPKDPDTFPPSILPKVEDAYVQMVRALAAGEEVRILVNDSKTGKRVSTMLRGVDKVSILELATVDVWVRDYGPTYVKGRDLALVKWRFNAWGDKYADLLPDDDAGTRIADLTGLRVFRPGVVLEGGSIDVNGSGTILTTEQCLLNPNRNLGLGRGELESVLKENLGVSNVIWLEKGIEGDDTDGHVDDIARFVGPGKVVVAEEGNPSDNNHGPLEKDRNLLVGASDERGRSLTVTPIPMPSEISSEDGRLPASHLNFYVGNSAVLVPTFGGRSDRIAIKVLEDALPDREAVGIDCRALVYGLGTLHCVTQQVPSLT
jgi:agmatine deiminase